MKNKRKNTSVIEQTSQELTNILRDTNSTQPIIILGFSGGPDSVCLFHCLLPLHSNGTIKLVTAHVNHGWRDDSQQDAQFCKNLSKKHCIEHYTFDGQHSARMIKWNGSQEEIGRKIRRNLFEKLLKEINADFIALAHHQQDQQETFFIRLLRGTTLQGLTGMQQQEQHYIRPLLMVNKQDIMDFLNMHKIMYRVDKTNMSEKYLRNRIRNNVLPALAHADKRFNAKFAHTLEHLREQEAYLHNLTRNTFNAVFEQRNKIYTGNLANYASLAPVLRKRLLLYWLSKTNILFSPSTAFLTELERFLLTNRGGSHIIAPNGRLQKKQNKFWAEEYKPNYKKTNLNTS